MNRIKVVKDTNYTTINNTIIKDKRLSLKAKGLFLTVMSLPDDWDFSVDGIISILKEDESAIRQAIRELVSYGYCTFIVERLKGRFVGTDYTFFEQPQAQEPYVDFPHTEKPRVEKQAQLSKERNKVKSESGTQGKTPEERKPSATWGESEAEIIYRQFFGGICLQPGQHNLFEQITNLDVWRKVCQLWKDNGSRASMLGNMVDRYQKELAHAEKPAQRKYLGNNTIEIGWNDPLNPFLGKAVIE